jgi:hypothetical protein
MSALLDIARNALPIAGAYANPEDPRAGFAIGQQLAGFLPSEEKRQAKESRRMGLEAQRINLEQQKLNLSQSKKNIQENRDQRLAGQYEQGALHLSMGQVRDSFRELGIPVSEERMAELSNHEALRTRTQILAIRRAMEEGNDGAAILTARRMGAVLDPAKGTVTMDGETFELSEDLFYEQMDKFDRQFAEEFRYDKWKQGVRDGDYVARSMQSIVNGAILAGSTKGQAMALSDTVYSGLSEGEKALHGMIWIGRAFRDAERTGEIPADNPQIAEFIESARVHGLHIVEQEEGVPFGRLQAKVYVGTPMGDALGVTSVGAEDQGYELMYVSDILDAWQGDKDLQKLAFDKARSMLEKPEKVDSGAQVKAIVEKFGGKILDQFFEETGTPKDDLDLSDLEKNTMNERFLNWFKFLPVDQALEGFFSDLDNPEAGEKEEEPLDRWKNSKSFFQGKGGPQDSQPDNLTPSEQNQGYSTSWGAHEGSTL